MPKTKLASRSDHYMEGFNNGLRKAAELLAAESARYRDLQRASTSKGDRLYYSARAEQLGEYVADIMRREIEVP